MPFFRGGRGRKRGRFYTPKAKGALTVRCRALMNPPAAAVGFDYYNALPATAIRPIATLPLEEGNVASGTQAETLIYQQLLQYTPDFGRLALTGNPSFMRYFDSFRFGTFAHIMRRVDSGANFGTVAGLDGVQRPANFGTRETVVRVYFRRLRLGESGTGAGGSTDITYQSFVSTPGVRSMSLRPGRKLVWRFNLMTYMRKMLGVMGRKRLVAQDSVMSTYENTYLAETKIPTMMKRLGWLPMGLLQALPFDGAGRSPFCDTIAGSLTGITPGTNTAGQGIGGSALIGRFLGQTMQFMFNCYGAAPFTAVNGVGVANFQPMSFPLITRSEHVDLHLRGMNCLTTSYLVGAVTRAYEYPMGESAGVSYPLLSTFAPPTRQYLKFPPLNSDTQTPAIQDGFDFPINVEVAPVPMTASPDNYPTLST